MKLKKLFILAITIACLIMTAVGTVACSGGTSFAVYNASGELIFDSQTTSVDVEYGTVYQIPQIFTVNGQDTQLESFTLKNASGEEIRTSYGSYNFMAVGEYSVEYVGGGHTFIVKIICKDTIAPTIRIISYDHYGTVGNSIAVPTAEINDLAGIASSVYSISSPSGTEKTLNASENSFLLEERGDYGVTLTATDNNGLSSSSTVTVKALDTYVDEDLKTGEIYSFNNSNYTDLVVETSSQNVTYSVVTEGYPVIENEEDGNGVLKIDGCENWGNVNTLFLLHEDVLANSGYEIKVKFAVTGYVDYIKLFKSTTLTDRYLVEQIWGLQPNQWYEMDINPIAFGYGLSFKNFVLQYRNRGNVDLYIDSIYFTQPEFVDEDWSSTNLGDFDEEGYLHHVYQNIYCDPTTTRSFRVGGSEFEILQADDPECPATNDASAYYPNIGPSGGVLSVYTADEWGGLTYMFPEPFDLSTGLYLRIRLWNAGNSNALILGAFDGKGYDSTNTYWYAYDTPYMHRGEWTDIVIPAEALRNFSTDNMISGIYLQQLVTNGATTSHRVHFYIDQIDAVYPDELSEQAGNNIATFENGTLYHITQNDVKGGSTFNIVENQFGATGKSLQITTEYSGSGFQYILDEPIYATSADSAKDLTFKIAVPNGSGVSGVNVSIGTSFTLFTLIESFNITEYEEWITFSIKGSDIYKALSGYAINRLMFSFITDGMNQDIYFDDLGFIDYSNDTTPPMVETESIKLNTYAENSIDLNMLAIELNDDYDFSPTYAISQLFDPSNIDITSSIIDGRFQPTTTGKYRLMIITQDTAGNTSEPIAITLNIDVITKEDYYIEALKFGSNSCLDLVTNTSPSIVVDVNAEDGQSLKAVIANNDAGKKTLQIDMGSIYKASEIEKIVIRYRYDTANIAEYWPRIYVNESNYYVQWMPVANVGSDLYTIIEIPNNLLINGVDGDGPKPGMNEDELLDWLLIDIESYQPAPVDYIYIDSIVVNLKPLPYDSFNTLKENTTDEYWIANFTDPDCSLLLSAIGDAIYSVENNLLVYSNASWADRYVQYSFGNNAAIKGGDISSVKVKFKEGSINNVMYIYLIGSDDSVHYLESSWTVDGEWGVATCTPSEIIAGRISNLDIKGVVITSSNASAEISVSEITYIKKT